ncbi:MAG: DUF3786 domain-containing protein [Spirochaetales bacterium]|nr:DUF3786 domain-containing protein [Spirochaetales bacterium]
MSNTRQIENSLLVAYDKAACILENAKSGEICRKTGAIFENGTYKIAFLSGIYEISMPEVRFITKGVPIIVQVLILHYLTSMDENPVRGEFISFRGIPGGMFYFKSFQQRALDKLISNFIKRPEELLEAGASLGGKKWITGDYSVVIPVFPKIDMVVQIFKADDEFPLEANILYSDNITNFLPAEDAAFLGGYLVGILSRARLDPQS